MSNSYSFHLSTVVILIAAECFCLTKELLEEKERIIKSFHGMTLSDIYEERQADTQRLDEIHEEIQNEKYETHSV